MKILVVDDDRLLADYLAGELKRRGHDAVPLTSGAQALAKAARDNFDLLICDLMLPDFNGIHTIRAIRQRKPLVPVIVLSSLDARKWSAKCREAGAVCYIQKPTSIEDLMEEVSLVEISRFRLNIGMIDTDPDHARAVEYELGSMGCAPCTWPSLKTMLASDDALATLTLLLVDRACPDTLAALDWAKAHHVTAVAFGSAYVGMEDEKLLRAGASLCVAKPVDGRSLLNQARFLVG